MNRPVNLTALTPAARTELIYGAAKRASDVALWRSVLGERTAAQEPAGVNGSAPLTDLDTLLQTLGQSAPATSAGQPAVSAASWTQLLGGGTGELKLGANQALAGTIEAAARRTGLPPAALAAIVNAEAAKDAGGRWNAAARNPRSSATGLGQFLSGTWIGEAERAGTNLNRIARERGWLDGGGTVLAGARAALLALRADPQVSIEATADFARGNLDRMGRQGITAGSGTAEVARTAYLAHHLGVGDAVRFLRGELNGAHAASLLAAQVGAGNAARRIAAVGEPAAAHRAWLNAYVDRHLRPESFTA